MVRIRLFRIGKKNQPAYKIVVTPKENPPQGGNFLEKIGHYNPTTKECKIDAEKAQKWLDDGAQPSDTVFNLFVKEGIIKKDKKPNHKNRSLEDKEKKEKTEKEEKTSEDKEQKNKKEKKEKTEEKVKEQKEKKSSDDDKKEPSSAKKEKED